MMMSDANQRWRGTIDAIKERCRIEEILGKYTALRRSGRTLVGRCPLHDDHTPSLVIYPETQSFYCFGCGAGGDVIDFLRAAEHQSWMAVVTQLANQVGVSLPDRAADDPHLVLRRDAIAAAIRHWTAWLSAPEGRGARAWLESRALPPHLLSLFRIGVSGQKSDSLVTALRSEGWSDDTLLDAGLAVKMPNGTIHDKLTRRVILPLHHGKTHAVVGVTGRTWVPTITPSYLTLPGTPLRSVLYGSAVAAATLAEATEQRCLVVVEGPFDVLSSLSIAPHLAVVGTMGSGLGDEQAQQVAALLGGEGTVVLAGDGDPAGAAGMIRSMRALRGVGVTDIRVALLPEGDDPDDVIRRDGSAWQRLIETAVPPTAVREPLLARAVPSDTSDTAKRREQLVSDFDQAVSGRAPPSSRTPRTPRLVAPEQTFPLLDRILVHMARTSPRVLWTGCAAVAEVVQSMVEHDQDIVVLPDALAITPTVAHALAAWRRSDPNWDADLPPTDATVASLPPFPEVVVDFAVNCLLVWFPWPDLPSDDERQNLAVLDQHRKFLHRVRSALMETRDDFTRERQRARYPRRTDQ